MGGVVKQWFNNASMHHLNQWPHYDFTQIRSWWETLNWGDWGSSRTLLKQRHHSTHHLTQLKKGETTRPKCENMRERSQTDGQVQRACANVRSPDCINWVPTPAPLQNQLKCATVLSPCFFFGDSEQQVALSDRSPDRCHFWSQKSWTAFRPKLKSGSWKNWWQFWPPNLTQMLRYMYIQNHWVVKVVEREPVPVETLPNPLEILPTPVPVETVSGEMVPLSAQVLLKSVPILVQVEMG